MTTRRLASLVPLALLLAGCATSPVNLTNSHPVKSRRLLPDYALYSRPVSYGAKLVVIRDAGRLDAFEKAEVLVDGRPVASLRPGERVDLYVYAGDRLLGLMAEPGFIDSPEVTHAFVFKPGQTYDLRVGVFNGHALDIQSASRVQ